MQVIYNPKCSKCKGLEKALDSNDVTWEKILYLNGLTTEQVQAIFEEYEGDWRDLVRQKESIFQDKGVNPKEMSENEMMAFLAKHPIAIQRPLVLKNKTVIIARDDIGVQKSID